MRTKCQYSPSKKSSPDCFLIGLVGGGDIEQLRWPGTGPTLRDVEREPAEQIGGVHSSMNNFVNKAHTMLESLILQAANLEML